MKWRIINFNTGNEELAECKSTLNWITDTSFKQKIILHPLRASIGKERDFLAEYVPIIDPGPKTCRACHGSGQISCTHYNPLPNDNSYRCGTCNNTGYYKCNACGGKGHH